MGGFGSGRPSRGRPTTNTYRSLDVNRLRKAGVLAAGWIGHSQWTHNGEPFGSISIHGGKEQVNLTYRWRRDEEDWQNVNQTIAIRWTECRFGGVRPYLICPGMVNGSVCAKTVTKLYGADRYYLSVVI